MREARLAASEPVVRLDSHGLEPAVLSSVVSPIWLGKISQIKKNLMSSWVVSAKHTDPRQSIGVTSPLLYRLFYLKTRFEPKRGFSFPADIWCHPRSMWIILDQRPLSEDMLANPDDITAEQVGTLGQFPRRWWETWEARQEYFDGSDNPSQSRQGRTRDDRCETHSQLPRQKAGMVSWDAI